MHLETCMSGDFSPDFQTSFYGMETDFTITEMSENLKELSNSTKTLNPSSPEIELNCTQSYFSKDGRFNKELTPEKDALPSLAIQEAPALSPLEEVLLDVPATLTESMFSDSLSQIPFSPPPPAINIQAADDRSTGLSLISSSNVITEALGGLNNDFEFTEEEWPTSFESLLSDIPVSTPLPELIVTANQQREEQQISQRQAKQTMIEEPSSDSTIPQERLLGLPGLTSSSEGFTAESNNLVMTNITTSISPMSISPGGSSIPSPLTSLRSSFNNGRRYKRPHSISPLNADDLDLNSIIRYSPNCLTSSPPLESNNVNTLSTPIGSYGHFLRRPETNNNSINRFNLNLSAIGSVSQSSKDTNSSAECSTILTPTSPIEQKLFEGSEVIDTEDSKIDMQSSTVYSNISYSNKTSSFTNTQTTPQLKQPPLYPIAAASTSTTLSTTSSNISRSSSCAFARSPLPSISICNKKRIDNIIVSPSSYDKTNNRVTTCTTITSIADAHPDRLGGFGNNIYSCSGVSSGSFGLDLGSSYSPSDGSVADDDINGSDPRTCRWVDCNATFSDRASLSRHIERAHVDQRKGDDYTCFWAACQRKYRAFNARYKLLIHMRVHSGEKPNKCSVSNNYRCSW